MDSTSLTAEPAVTITDIADPTAAGVGIELLDLDAVQLVSRPLRARRVTLSLDKATVVRHTVDTRLRTRTRVHEGRVGYVSFGRNSQGSVGGIAVRPGTLLAAAAGAEAMFVVEPGWESITCLLSLETIHAHLEARQRVDGWRVPLGLELLHADPARVQHLHAWAQRLVEAALANPDRWGAGTPARAAAEVELIERLLAALRTRADREPLRQELTRQEQSRIVRLAEDHALAHVDERLYVSDLCRVTAVSERTLEVAFKLTLGLSPMAYLNRLRLHRVRDTLQAPSRNARTVSAVALDWGFCHFGEFSRAYKDCFGELPSETLRRQRAEPAR